MSNLDQNNVFACYLLNEMMDYEQTIYMYIIKSSLDLSDIDQIIKVTILLKL